MRRSDHYAKWLNIADELESLHSFLYGDGGYLAEARGTYYEITDLLHASHWIRKRCASGWWYWWDKGWLGGRAADPLRSLKHAIADGGGFYESTDAGREVIARVERLDYKIAIASTSKE